MSSLRSQSGLICALEKKKKHGITSMNLELTLKRLPNSFSYWYLLQIDLKVGSYMPTSRLLSLYDPTFKSIWSRFQ